MDEYNIVLNRMMIKCLPDGLVILYCQKTKEASQDMSGTMSAEKSTAGGKNSPFSTHPSGNRGGQARAQGVHIPTIQHQRSNTYRQRPRLPQRLSRLRKTPYATVVVTPSRNAR
ncbi:hypothetical protein HPB50_020173 [Hyalomma asiaticum]|uniref:Uncharacterized protein n=1 Tax=Hyalomma asiaticum TaxID=266040 RepID=A0ACB7TKA3_HYAAI|nr:hypothetical protein HPB50_020173 [Hyalomma asiaticum]